MPARPTKTSRPNRKGNKPDSHDHDHDDHEDPDVSAILHMMQAPTHKPNLFRTISQKASAAVGRPWAFITALAVVIGWALLGPVFHYSDTWQLVINTGTTIITFLMVFLIQSAQNRDTEALRIKLDALILALSNVSNAFVDVEELDDEDLEKLRKKLRVLAAASSVSRPDR
jgi:low affinity Fe/Cu permease